MPSRIRELHDIYVKLQHEEPDRSFIALHFGEPDLGTPEFIVEAGCEALRNGAVFYEPNRGRTDLRAELVRYYQRQYGVGLSPDNFVVSCGAIQAIFLAMASLVRAGDSVINITPAWPNFTGASQLAGAAVHELALIFDGGDQAFRLDFDKLEETVRRDSSVRLVIANTPSNPTGTVMSAEEKRRLLTFCREHELWLLGDEIYDRIVFTEDCPPSFLNLATPEDRVLLINGLSKAWCMTGWRIGFIIGEPELTARMAQLQEFITSNAPSVAQVAAITALADGEAFVAESLVRYRRLRDLALTRIRKIAGAVVARPDGAFYLFLQLPGSEDSFDFCRELLYQQGVTLAPGCAFGAGGEGWLRLCFAQQDDRLDEAMDRIEQFVNKS